MAIFERAGSAIHYEVQGEGPPVLLLAPGGMRSAISVWDRAPWHPLRELANGFRLIALDQRNAGQSRADVSPDDGWHSYAEDHVALLDHLGIGRCLVIGGCIGCSFALELMRAAPGRVSAAVLQNPIGLHENRDMFYAFFDSWADELRATRPDVPSAEAMRPFRERMYSGDFVFNVSRDFVRQLATPLLVLCGNDPYHPTPISRELCALAPNARLVESWKERLPETVAEVRAFLAAHAP
jgi:pimeloyl-ACP methyl ester carboxylesterase